MAEKQTYGGPNRPLNEPKFVQNDPQPTVAAALAAGKRQVHHASKGKA